MKTIVMAGIGAMLLTLSSTAASGAGQTVPVISDAGQPLTLDVIAIGRFAHISENSARTIGTDTRGGDILRHDHGAFAFIPARTLPMAVGNGFGCRVRIPLLAAEDTLSIDVRVSPPDAPAAPIEGRLTWNSAFSGQVRHIVWSFSDDNRHRHQIGQWTLTLVNHDRTLISVVFTVVPP